MQSFRGIFLLFGALALEASLPAQQPSSALVFASQRETAAAETELQQIKQLVSTGALPASRIGEAQAKLDDARDEEVLARTLYNPALAQDLSGGRASEMIGAAMRRRDRQRARVERFQKLIDEGVAAPSQINSLEEDLNMRETALALAQHRAQLLQEMAAAARREDAVLLNPPPLSSPLMEKFTGSGRFDENRQLKPIEIAFEGEFHSSLPISADGETAVHRALGFDHRGRVDVAVNPDTPQGRWLKHYLKAQNIPYFAFRAAVPGQATGAHIHIGPPSTRLLETAARGGMK